MKFSEMLDSYADTLTRPGSHKAAHQAESAVFDMTGAQLSKEEYEKIRLVAQEKMLWELAERLLPEIRKDGTYE